MTSLLTGSYTLRWSGTPGPTVAVSFSSSFPRWSHLQITSLVVSSSTLRKFDCTYGHPFTSFRSHLSLCFWCFNRSLTVAGKWVDALGILGTSAFLSFKSVACEFSWLTVHISQLTWLLMATLRCNHLATKQVFVARAHPRYQSTRRATMQVVEAVSYFSPPIHDDIDLLTGCPTAPPSPTPNDDAQ